MVNRPTGIFKKENNYMQTISPALYEKTPKAVFAALAVSLMVNHKGVDFLDIDTAILEEWKILWEQGILPQQPPKR